MVTQIITLIMMNKDEIVIGFKITMMRIRFYIGTIKHYVSSWVFGWQNDCTINEISF